MGTANVTLFAKWTAIPAETYPVTYNANGATGGTIPAAQTKTQDVSLTLAANSGNLVKTGFTFAGWNTTIAGNGTNYAVNSAYTANATVILYAKWTATPVNGVCGATNNLCTAGTSVDVADTDTQYKWTCEGNNGGNDASCTINKSLPPTIVSVTSSKANGSYREGTVIPVSVEFSQPVTVVGIPTLTLETGTTDAIVSYKEKAADGKTLIFEYTVAATHTSNDLNYLSTTALALPASASIKDTTTNTNATLALPALASTVSLAGSKALVIDTTAPGAPAAPIVPLQANISLSSTETGTYIATGNTITINIPCTTGQRVKIYLGTSLSALDSMECPASNLTIFTPSLASQSGYYYYTATISDAAGNESSRSSAITVFKQTTSNAPGTPDLDPLFDLGVSSTDNLTSEVQPRFTLTCTSGATVNMYDNATLIGTASCVANTTQILPIQPLSTGVHSITAKQIINGITSAASGALTLSIDTAPLNVTLARAADQSEPATSSTIKFTATFSRPIDANSFICSDVTVTNGVCNTVVLLSGNTYTINITATTA
jgi:uncharacterized repeat protein (TIGR02543 family)